MKLANTNSLQISMLMPQLREFCERHHIQRLAVFGSALTGEFHSGSDVDLLVEFETGRTPGLEFFAMQDELSQLLGRPVDLNTPNFLSRYFRDQVMAEAEVLVDRA